jgi:adenylate cyclase
VPILCARASRCRGALALVPPAGGVVVSRQVGGDRVVAARSQLGSHEVPVPGAAASTVDERECTHCSRLLQPALRCAAPGGVTYSLPMLSRCRRGIEWVARVGISDGDTADERIYKEAVNLSALLISVLACFWVGTYAVLGLWLSAAIPFSYQLVTLASFVFLAGRGRHTAFRRSQLACMLVLPFLLQWSLGGFEPSGAVALWAVTAPFGALTFSGARAAVPWFIAFLALLTVSAALDGVLPDAEIPSWLLTVFFLLNVGAVSLTAFLLLQYFVRARERAHVLLAEERERSERLLLNVLPAPIAERLKRASGVIADRCPEVSVLFADLAGFTPVAERLPPEEVVGLLNGIFSEFDELVARHGLEKIKTIGDGYMVAGGIPSFVPDHAERIADLALDMQQTVESRGPEFSLGLRIGIDTGPVVAGVIGRSRFGYDLWGDTVNTASRMESHAPPGTIQVTERTRNLLADHFELERREEVEIKGKAPMTTYLLLGRQGASALVLPGARGQAPRREVEGQSRDRAPR